MFLIFSDLQNFAHFSKNEEKLEQKKCKIDYDENNCDDPIPYLKKFCQQKKYCFEKNVKKIYTKSFGKLSGQIFNNFFDGISFKSLIVGVVMFYVMACLAIKFLNAKQV